MSNSVDQRPASFIEARGLQFHYPSTKRDSSWQLHDFSLQIEQNELICLLGPSGGGKSTLLRLLGGYLSPSAGALYCQGHDITHVPPEQRQFGMVFQNYALFPHLTAFENVAFPLRVRGMGRVHRQRTVQQLLTQMQLPTECWQRLPRQLSGGQQQRVALARALSFAPKLLLLDEPFANLDRPLRDSMRPWLRQQLQNWQITTVLVTHDRAEALYLADRCAILHAGQLEQVATPRQIMACPLNRTVARFLGHENIYPLVADSDRQLLLEGWPALPRPPQPPRPIEPTRPNKPIGPTEPTEPIEPVATPTVQTTARCPYWLLHTERCGWQLLGAALSNSDPVTAPAHADDEADTVGLVNGKVVQVDFAGAFETVQIQLHTGAMIHWPQLSGAAPLRPGTPIQLTIPAEAWWPLDKDRAD